LPKNKLDDTQINVVIADKCAHKTKVLASKLGRLENIISRAQPPDNPPNVLKKTPQGGATHTYCASGNKKTNAPKGNLKKSKKTSATAADSTNTSSTPNKLRTSETRKSPLMVPTRRYSSRALNGALKEIWRGRRS
jgi:hypothetical protein